MGGAPKTWFTVYTKPRQERVALAHLERQGFACFLPLALNPYQRQRSSHVRVSLLAKKGSAKTTTLATKAEPLFPRYLFLNAAPTEQSLGPVRSTRGVAGLVRFGQRLAEMPERAIRAIEERCCPETGLVRLDPVPVGPGDKVKVFDGPLAGLTGIFQERKGETRALLLMTLLGRESTVEVQSLHLKRAL